MVGLVAETYGEPDMMMIIKIEGDDKVCVRGFVYEIDNIYVVRYPYLTEPIDQGKKEDQ